MRAGLIAIGFLLTLAGCQQQKFKGAAKEGDAPNARGQKMVEIKRDAGQVLPSTDALVPTAPGSKPNPVTSSGPVDTPETPETVSPPVQISGAFLHCATLLEASDDLPQADVGCRVDDQQGNRIDPAMRGAKANFIIAMPMNNVTITTRYPTFPARDYDAVFQFNGKNKAETMAAANGSVVSVNIVQLTTNASLYMKSASVEELKVEPKRGGWTKALEGGNSYFVDEVTSLIWGVDDGKSYDYFESVKRCDDLIYAGRSNWRLPTITELVTARLDGLGTTYADAANMNISATRFGAYRSGTLEFPDQTPRVGVSRVWNLDLSNATAQNTARAMVENRISVVCVHEQ